MEEVGASQYGGIMKNRPVLERWQIYLKEHSHISAMNDEIVEDFQKAFFAGAASCVWLIDNHPCTPDELCKLIHEEFLEFSMKFYKVEGRPC
jgi:hypothetical protein